MVTSSYPLFEGDGTAPFIEEIARGLAARGHQIDMVLPSHPRFDRAHEAGLRFFPFPYAPVPGLSVWGYAQSMKADRGFKWRTLLVAPFAALATKRAVQKRLRAETYEVVHAHWVVPGGVLARGPARNAQRAFVISLHGSDVFAAEKNGLVGSSARAALSAAGAITACSSDLRTRAIALGAPGGRIRTVPYGVDHRFFGARSGSREASAPSMRSRLGADPSQTLVVAVGRLVEKKGFAFLVDGLAGVKDLHLAIIGDGDLEEALRVRALSAGASVTLAGRFSRTEIREALECADVAAVPSVVDSAGNVDGLPNSLLEAMAAGKAVVASRVAGIPDVMNDGVEGLLVPPGDPASLREALLNLAREPERRRTMGEAARGKVERELTWEKVAATIEDCYVQAQALAKR